MDPNPFIAEIPPSRDFVAWCKEKMPELGKEEKFSIMALKAVGSAIQREVLEELSRDCPNWFNFNSPLVEEGYVFDAKKLETRRRIDIHIESSFTVRNLKVHELYLKNANVVLEKCEIQRCVITDYARVIMIDTYVGTMDLKAKGCKEIEVKGGGVLNIESPPPKGENPFIGSVVFIDTFFPRNTKKYLLKNAQPYRNMRHHLMSLENEVMASKFHSLELQIERESDPIPNNVMNYLYGCFSDYGNSIRRPGALWLLLFFCSWISVWFVDGAVLAMNDNLYIGWQGELVGTESSGLRAIVLVGQYVFNPLGVLGVKSLVVAKSSGVLCWMMVQSLLSATLITLLILAIRRRFKLK